MFSPPTPPTPTPSGGGGSGSSSMSMSADEKWQEYKKKELKKLQSEDEEVLLVILNSIKWQ